MCYSRFETHLFFVQLRLRRHVMQHSTDRMALTMPRHN